MQVARGGRVESQTDQQAVLVYGKRPNHILHLILTLVTFGLWAVVWILVALTQKEKRAVITVAPDGQVHHGWSSSPGACLVRAAAPHLLVKGVGPLHVCLLR